jgi:hypothetical protein
MCRIAIVLWLYVIKSDCNRSANKIQSSELEPVIIAMRTTRTRDSIISRVKYASYEQIHNAKRQVRIIYKVIHLEEVPN